MSPASTSWTHRGVAATIALAGLLAALAVVLTARTTADLEAEVTARGVTADALATVGARLRTALDEAAAGTGPGERRIRFELAEENGIPAATAVRARDTGRPLLHESGVVVVATYDTPSPPESVAARREAITGLSLLPVRLQTTLASLRPDGGGILVAGPGRVVSAVPGPPPEGAASHVVEVPSVLAADWTLTVWVRSDGVSLLAWTIAGALAVAGLVGAGVALHRARGASRAREELARLRTQSTTVAALAAVAQRSLDLADVLPAVATQLTDALGLRGVALSAPTTLGDRPFFASGDPVDAGEAQELRPGAALAGAAAGQVLAVPLARGGRTVARMHLLAGRDLGEEDMGTLSAVAEILSSALANAEAFAQQRELLQRLRTVDELKTVFLATASHELRTPVGVISGFARLLARKVDELTADQIRTYADRVDSNAQQLGTLVDNLLDFSRLERGVGDDPAQRTEIDLGVTVDHILARQPDLATDHVVVRQVVPGLRVTGTEHALERVLTNLVGNAAKYAPAGTTIRVHVRENAGSAELVVDDEGPGVPASDREQVFSRFFRGSGDAVVRTRGAGLGLAIVREFAASMHGRVSVTAAPSGGARFVVSYPLVDAEQPAEGESHVVS